MNAPSPPANVSAPKLTAKPSPKPKSARHRARELVIQGLYSWRLNPDDVGVVDAHVRDLPEFNKADAALYQKLLLACIDQAAQLDAAIVPHLDRKLSELSPVEHAVLSLGCHELQSSLDVPYRVVINEAVELAKSFGGTDGHKYVNGVLDRLAAIHRAIEMTHARVRPNK